MKHKLSKTTAGKPPLQSMQPPIRRPLIIAVSE
jgi:hypothetical protein